MNQKEIDDILIIQALAEADQDCSGKYPGWKQERPHYVTKQSVGVLAKAYRDLVEAHKLMSQQHLEMETNYLMTRDALESAEHEIAKLKANKDFQQKNHDCGVAPGKEWENLLAAANGVINWFTRSYEAQHGDTEYTYKELSEMREEVEALLRERISAIKKLRGE